MRIKCPYCGERPVEEFSFLGDATLKRPESLEPSAFDDWYNYVYLRDNPRGRFSELWHHGGGCRSWLVVERDTATHEVYSVSLAKEQAATKRRRKS